MQHDEITYAAAQALMELEPGCVVVSVARLPEKPFGWVVVFEGRGGERRRVTFEHRAAEDRRELKAKIKAGLAGRSA